VVLLVWGLVTLVSRAPRPDVEGPLRRADALITREKYSEAIEELNRAVLPFVGTKDVSGEQRVRYHLLTARALYRGQKALGISREDNNSAIAARFAEAERLGGELEPGDVYAYADAVLDMGQVERALSLADRLPEAMARQRAGLYRRVVERVLASPAPDYDLALSLVGRVRGVASLSRDDAAWVAARQAEIMLRQGYHNEAVARLLPLMPGFETSEPRLRGELHLLLGRAYLDGEQVDDALRHLRRAEAMLSREDPLMGHVLLAMGRALERAAPTDASELLGNARECFRLAATRFEDPAVVLPALLGLGQVESRLSLTDGSVTVEECLATYENLTRMIRSGARGGGVNPDIVAASLLDRFRERFDAPRTELRASATAFVALAETLFEYDAVPAPVLLALGEANLRAAAEHVSINAEEAVAAVQGLSLEGLDPATRSEVKQRLLAGADYLRRHAQRVVITDSEAYKSSLWRAALSYDRAGNQSDAIAVLQEFLASFPSDPRTPEARFRLARAHQMRGDSELAAGMFRKLIEESSGPFADAAHVPLAQVLLGDGDPSNDAEGQELLLGVVSGKLGPADNPHFAPALATLAHHLYESGQYEQAIERLGEVLERFPDRRDAHMLRFRLADAYRRSAERIDRRLGESMPDAERRMLEGLRDERLRLAMGLFAIVRDDLERVPETRRGAFEDLTLMHAYFYVADCAYALREYESAIRLYDAARERYNRRPEALVALVQIVSAHLRQGDVAKALTAHRRARNFYESLPAEVWESVGGVMRREDWERWLESTDEISRLAGGESTPVGERGASPPRDR
jgi:tetratricopeptide (TPR) repeat protein